MITRYIYTNSPDNWLRRMRGYQGRILCFEKCLHTLCSRRLRHSSLKVWKWVDICRYTLIWICLIWWFIHSFIGRPLGKRGISYLVVIWSYYGSLWFLEQKQDTPRIYPSLHRTHTSLDSTHFMVPFHSKYLIEVKNMAQRFLGFYYYVIYICFHVPRRPSNILFTNLW